jgi:hypothetical protein
MKIKSYHNIGQKNSTTTAQSHYRAITTTSMQATIDHNRALAPVQANQAQSHLCSESNGRER